MVSFKILSLAALSFVVPALALGRVTLYSKEPCTGETAEIPANNKCTEVPPSLVGKVAAISIPDDVECNFYMNSLCLFEPLASKVEAPGVCKFSQWDINGGKAGNVLGGIKCFDSSEIPNEDSD